MNENHATQTRYYSAAPIGTPARDAIASAIERAATDADFRTQLADDSSAAGSPALNGLDVKFVDVTGADIAFVIPDADAELAAPAQFVAGLYSSLAEAPKERAIEAVSILAYRSAFDAELRSRLTESPSTTFVEEIGRQNTQEGVEVQVVEQNGADIVVLVAEATATESALSEEDLEAVAGGAGVPIMDTGDSCYAFTCWTSFGCTTQ